MRNLNPETGQLPATSCRAPGQHARLKDFLEKLDLMRQNHWSRLLARQAEQFRRLASLVEARPLPVQAVGPDLGLLARHRNGGERIDRPACRNAPLSRPGAR